MNFEILIEAIKSLYPLHYNHFLLFTVINTFQITWLTTLRISMTLESTIYNILLLLYMCLLYVVVCTILVESVLSGISSNQPYLSMSKYFHPDTLIQERKGGSLQNFSCICFEIPALLVEKIRNQCQPVPTSADQCRPVPTSANPQMEDLVAPKLVWSSSSFSSIFFTSF